MTTPHMQRDKKERERDGTVRGGVGGENSKAELYISTSHNILLVSL